MTTPRLITFPTFFPKIYGVRYYGQNFVSNLSVDNISPSFLYPKILSVGERIYQDNTFTITHCDLDFNKTVFIQTFSDRKNSIEKEEISFHLNNPSIVWVAYDEKCSSELPSWLKYRFQRTGRSIKSNQGKEFQLYKRQFRQGQVVLGGNALGVQRAGDNYFVLVENITEQNIVVTRDVLDITIDELKFTSDFMLQLYSKGKLIHNIWLDPMFDLYLNDQNQFTQNGLAVLEVLFSEQTELIPAMQDFIYYKVTSGPVDTGQTTTFKYYELVDGELVLRTRVVPVILPAAVTQFTSSEIINSITYQSFLEAVNELNASVLPFNPIIENFIPQDRQPGPNETYLDFEPQEPLVDPDITVTGSNFINKGDSVTLFWNSTNSNRIMLDNREIDFKGHIEESPPETVYYTFRVEADDDVLVKNFNIQVKTDILNTRLDLPELILKSNKKIIDIGDTVTIEWQANNYNHLYLGDVELNTSSGSVNVVINDNSDFILKAVNNYLTVQLNIFVRIKITV